MAWVLSSYRRARWLWLLPDLGADTKRMARGLQTFIVSHYAFHAGAEAMVKYVTHTLYYKFMLELWDTSHEQLQSGKYYGHEFSRYGPEALNRSALCKEQRRMALVILKIRSQRNRGKGPAVRCVMFMLQILESLARSYVKLSRRKAPHAGMETVGLQKAYLQIYERRTKTFNDKYMVEICNILRRHENSVKALELMIKETLKFLQSLDWKSLHLNQKDCDELASYRKFIQCSLLLTDNTSLIAGCRLVISKWPTKP
ncbi:ADL103Wp [Eremothecium gossypii ATCC 10895]|uniref:ADL103Wp n=1 Tax=Eremothecium gossypii (strain ATCC 10895 / CBS 109.51 / FGSC 9923 / NRRL Y-1056) TaxID=284811 RepID=Q75AM6_EREGS|nr:ADL103Wp [Eremothecium gossypii ATCC 10895]AAS51817.2 ADL103Wp [Eremothecium gossypii ATCC 10895]AEY96114.1 FADL103Wp [Eremothecium gossypii FDAG1]